VARHVHLILDRDAAAATLGEAAASLALAVPDSMVCVELVRGGDTVEVANLVARLALGRGPAGRVIAHDVAPSPNDPGPWPAGCEDCFCVARSHSGALVVGPNAGWGWSVAVRGLGDLVQIDVPAGGPPPHSAARLAVAVAHVACGHPHAVAGRIDRDGVPVLPQA
jgi:hypothetical protein